MNYTMNTLILKKDKKRKKNESDVIISKKRYGKVTLSISEANMYRSDPITNPGAKRFIMLSEKIIFP